MIFHKDRLSYTVKQPPNIKLGLALSIYHFRTLVGIIFACCFLFDLLETNFYRVLFCQLRWACALTRTLSFINRIVIKFVGNALSAEMMNFKNVCSTYKKGFVENYSLGYVGSCLSRPTFSEIVFEFHHTQVFSFCFKVTNSRPSNLENLIFLHSLSKLQSSFDGHLASSLHFDNTWWFLM